MGKELHDNGRVLRVQQHGLKIMQYRQGHARHIVSLPVRVKCQTVEVHDHTNAVLLWHKATLAAVTITEDHYTFM